MAEQVDDAMKRADEALAALKQTKPRNDAEARVRSCELIRLNQILVEASRKVVNATAAKRLNGASNGAKPAGKSQGLTDGEIGALAKGLVGWLGPILDDLEKRLAELEKRKTATKLAARIAGIEGTMLKDGGVWREQFVYKPGMVVTHDGTAWVCQQVNANARPGQSDCWRLMVKSKGRR